MKKLTRVWLALVLALTVVFPLAGCEINSVEDLEKVAEQVMKELENVDLGEISKYTDVEGLEEINKVIDSVVSDVEKQVSGLVKELEKGM